MEDNIAENVSREDYLISKCNMQLDHIKGLQKSLINKEREIQKLKSAEAKKDSLLHGEKQYISESFIEVFILLFQVMENLIKNNSFFAVKRATNNTKSYMTTDYNAVKAIIENIGLQIEPLKLLKIWSELGFLYQDDSGKFFINYTVEGRTVRAIRVKKEVVAFIKESMLKENNYDV